MMWSWPGMPNTWGYALTTVGMMLFWILVIFGAIVAAQHLGRVNRSPVAKPARRDVSNISSLRHVRAESDPSHRQGSHGLRHDAPATGCGTTTTRPPSDAPLPRHNLQLLTGP